MQATLALREKAMQLLAADADTLAPAADANKIALVKAPFTPNEGLKLTDITLADFDGSTPIAVGVGTQPEGLDPNTSNAIITLKPPAGGWRFETTGDTNLPQTIYGFVLVNNAGDELYAADTLPSPEQLTDVNQVINLNNVLLTQLAGSIE
jgi:hypothetical protein